MNPILKALLAEVKRHLGWIAFSFLLLVLVGGSQTLLIFLSGPALRLLFAESHGLAGYSLESLSPFLGKFLDKLALEPSNLLVWIPVMLGACALVRSLSLYFYNVIQESLILKIIISLRSHLFSKIIRARFSFFSSKTSSVWMSHLMNDVLVLQNLISDVVRVVLKDIIIVLSCVVTILFLEPLFMLYAVLVGACMALGLKLVASKLFRGSKTLQELQGIFSEKINHYRNYKGFYFASQNIGIENSYDEINSRYFNESMLLAKIKSALSPIVEYLAYLVFAFIFYFYFSSQYFVEVIAAVGFLIKPIKNLSEQFSKFQQTVGAADHLNQILEKAQSFDDQEDVSLNRLLQATRSEVQVSANGQHFCFPDFALKPGLITLVVGDSGVGKTTLLEALAGLYAIKNENNTDEYFKRSESSLLSQAPYVFRGDMESNLQYGTTQFDDTVLLDEHLKFFEVDALDQNRKNLHLTLSGGEKQRICMIRALIRQKKILLLDEPTSALNPHLAKKDCLKNF